MNAEEIAKVIAGYLDDRDDIGQAWVEADAPTNVQIVTQGGATFTATIEGV